MWRVKDSKSLQLLLNKRCKILILLLSHIIINKSDRHQRQDRGQGVPHRKYGKEFFTTLKIALARKNNIMPITNFLAAAWHWIPTQDSSLYHLQFIEFKKGWSDDKQWNFSCIIETMSKDFNHDFYILVLTIREKYYDKVIHGKICFRYPTF